VAQLAKAVADIDVEHLSMDDYKRIESSRFGDDEVGVLAGTIEKTLERISAFVARERYFTSSASHELRTPITATCTCTLWAEIRSATRASSTASTTRRE
jgi:signal transduction histidine kinase